MAKRELPVERPAADIVIDEVVAWRLDVLERAGYPLDAALTVALRRDIDVHACVKLLERKCPVTLALQIML